MNLGRAQLLSILLLLFLDLLFTGKDSLFEHTLRVDLLLALNLGQARPLPVAKLLQLLDAPAPDPLAYSVLHFDPRLFTTLELLDLFDEDRYHLVQIGVLELLEKIRLATAHKDLVHA
jgi:hypothetical protein